MTETHTFKLLTDRLILRHFTLEDLDDFHSLVSDPEVNKFLPHFIPESKEQSERLFKKLFLNHYQVLPSFRFAICLKENNRAIGYVIFSKDESCDFGYALKKEHWNKGITTEAAQEVINYIKKYNYNFITATHDINNPQSGEVMKKLGMSYKYSYVEQWMPKNIEVIFRLYQLNININNDFIYMEYWNKYENHFIENNI